MADQEIEELKKEADQRLYEYISILEETNSELLNTLKKCLTLLTQFSEIIPDNEDLEETIAALNDIIKVGERVNKEEIFD
jgi:hypothetical protein